MRSFFQPVRAFVVLLWSGLLLFPSLAYAQSWPQRTVRIILPLPAGGATDVAARLFAQGLSVRWRHPVIVENRPGADGITAVTAFLGSDDHTLLLSFAGLITINPIEHDDLPYDPAHDLVPIAPIIDNFFAFAASKTLNAASLGDLVKLAQDQPGKLNWAATSGLPDYIFAAFQKGAGITMTRVSYKDFAPALQDLAEGRIQVAVTSLALLLPQVQAGKANLLLVTNRERSPLAPDVPTALEVGRRELTFDGVVGFYGHHDIPVAIKERIAADVTAVGAEPTIRAKVESLGSLVRVGTPSEFAATIEEQRKKIEALNVATARKTH
jgi:tripartite-type tricarboxylate transporter receptor subunit TctC